MKSPLSPVQAIMLINSMTHKEGLYVGNKYRQAYYFASPREGRFVRVGHGYDNQPQILMGEELYWFLDEMYLAISYDPDYCLSWARWDWMDFDSTVQVSEVPPIKHSIQSYKLVAQMAPRLAINSLIEFGGGK